MTSYILDGNAVYPEGIAHLPGSPNFYVGSTTDGTIFKGTLGQAATEVLLPADAARPFAVGMKVDEAGRLYIAGGMSGQMFVYNTATKALIKSFDTPAAPDRFINDVALSTDAAYFTDSGRPTLFRVSRTATGVGDTAEAWLDLTTTIIQYQPTDPAFGPNLNGIVVTPDNKYLIVVQSNTGKLFRITIADKSISEIDLGGSQVQRRRPFAERTDALCRCQAQYRADCPFSGFQQRHGGQRPSPMPACASRPPLPRKETVCWW